MTSLRLKPAWIIVLMGMLCVVTPFAIDMYLPSFGSIAKEFNTTTYVISFSLSSYFIGFALGQVLYGPFLDRFGRKKPLYVGLVVYILASIGCSLSHSIHTFIAFRFIQALGGCVAQVAAIAMVRDFFPIKEGAKIFSMLFLIIGISPLLAPSIGSALVSALGWRWIFAILAAYAFTTFALVATLLPEGHQPDPSISLRLGPIVQNFWTIFKQPQFTAYSLAGAFSFGGLFGFVAGSPIIFMEVFHVSARTFGLIFAGLATGFIGSNQINVLLLRRFSSAQIFLGSLLIECPTALLFLAGSYCHWFGLAATLALLFICLSSLGLAYPNAAALAMSPFERNIGSASAMLGFLQIGVSGLASATIGLLDSHQIMPVAFILASMSWVGLGIYLVGRRNMGQLRFVEEKDAMPLTH